MQLAGSIEQSPGADADGSYAVYLVHRARNKVLRSVTAGHTSRCHQLITGLEILGGTSERLMCGESRKIPFLIGFNHVIKIRHSTKQTAKSEMGKAPESVCLTKKVILLILLDVQALINVGYCHIAPSDGGEHRLGYRLVVSLASVERDFLKEILRERSLLEILLGDTHSSSIRHICRVVPRESVLLEKVVIERIRDVDSLHVLATVGLVDPVKILAERRI